MAWRKWSCIVNPGLMYPGMIRYFIVHVVEIDRYQKCHAFTVVNWLKSSEEDFGFGNSLSVWCAQYFEYAGPAVFLPVQRIHFKFLASDKVYSGQKYLIVAPICIAPFS